MPSVRVASSSNVLTAGIEAVILEVDFRQANGDVVFPIELGSCLVSLVVPLAAPFGINEPDVDGIRSIPNQDILRMVRHNHVALVVFVVDVEVIGPWFDGGPDDSGCARSRRINGDDPSPVSRDLEGINYMFLFIPEVINQPASLNEVPV